LPLLKKLFLAVFVLPLLYYLAQIVILGLPETATLRGVSLIYVGYVGFAIAMSIWATLPLLIYRLYRLIFRRPRSRSTEGWWLGFGVVFVVFAMFGMIMDPQ
jgi:hypothetical protein